MQATTDSISGGHGQQLLSISKASEFLGCHPNSLRMWSDSGQIPTVTLPSGHRRYSLGDLREHIGLDAEPTEDKIESDGIKVALVARVSSSKQSSVKGEDASDLTRQQDKLFQYAQDKYGYGRDHANLTLYSRTSSGMNFNCSVFQSLVKDILEGKFEGGVILACHSERIIRFGLEFFKMIATFGKCEVLIIGDEEEEKGYGESLAEDLLAVITHFSARHYGRRSRLTCARTLSKQVIDRMLELRRKNTSIQQIRVILKKGILARICG